MNDYIAALPMYDWRERRAAVDAEWATIRTRLRAVDLSAPDTLVRRNADMPAVAGGIADESGRIIAPDPATLPPDELDLEVLWRHPRLLFGQACWGPMELGLAAHVRVTGQPDYSAFEGGKGGCYASAIVMRARTGDGHMPAPEDGAATIPLDRLRGRRFAFNGAESMSGLIGLMRDLQAAGEGIGIFSGRIPSGGHRNSIIAVAGGEADVAAVDCRSWALARRHEPAVRGLCVVGWTARRKGLPYICSSHLSEQTSQLIQRVIAENDEARPVL